MLLGAEKGKKLLSSERQITNEVTNGNTVALEVLWSANSPSR